jgi:hypothetical protein
MKAATRHTRRNNKGGSFGKTLRTLLGGVEYQTFGPTFLEKSKKKRGGGRPSHFHPIGGDRGAAPMPRRAPVEAKEDQVRDFSHLGPGRPARSDAVVQAAALSPEARLAASLSPARIQQMWVRAFEDAGVSMSAKRRRPAPTGGRP